MSKIAFLAVPPVGTSAIAAAAKLLGLPIKEAKDRIETGEPLYEAILFMNDHPEVAALLGSLVALLVQAGVIFRVFELEEDEHFATAPREEIEVDPEILSNILAEWQRRDQEL